VTALESAESLAGLVIGLIHAELVGCDEWVACALRELAAAEGSPPWLAELCTTYDAAEAVRILYTVSSGPSVEDRLGCRWLRHVQTRGRFDDLLDDALAIAGGWDTGGGFIPYQSELMDLARRMEDPRRFGSRALREEATRVRQDTIALLAPLGELVRLRAHGRVTFVA
jgi:hypothetical protein